MGGRLPEQFGARLPGWIAKPDDNPRPEMLVHGTDEEMGVVSIRHFVLITLPEILRKRRLDGTLQAS
jgi:hypothetical protein